MGRPEDRFRNGTKGSISNNNNNSVFKGKKDNVFGNKQEKELVPKHEKELGKKREPLVVIHQDSEPIAEVKKVVIAEEQVTNGLVDVNELVQSGVASGVDYLDTLLASKKVSVPTPKKDHKSTAKSNQSAPEYFANKRAKKRLIKVSIKFIVISVISEICARSNKWSNNGRLIYVWLWCKR